jgi:DNA-binding MarR family transcriptional regulator
MILSDILFILFLYEQILIWDLSDLDNIFLLMKRLRDINRKINLAMEEIYEPYGLTAQQAFLIEYLFHNGKQTVTELSDSLCTGKSNLSPMCKRLEKSGYVIRVRDNLDQRVIYIDLTDYAKTIVIESSEQISRTNQQVFRDEEAEAEAIRIGFTLLEQRLTLCRKNSPHGKDQDE